MFRSAVTYRLNSLLAIISEISGHGPALIPQAKLRVVDRAKPFLRGSTLVVHP